MLLAALLQVGSDVDVDVEALVKLVLDGVEKGNWWIVAGPALALFIHFGKKLIAPKWPAFSEFLHRPLVAFATPFVIAFLVGSVQTLATVKGLPSQAELIALFVSALKVGATAVAAYVGIKKRAESKAIAEEKAATAITDKETAVTELNKP